MMRDEASEDETIAAIVIKDRERLSSFAENLYNGVSFDDQEDELKVWWLSRY
jgi:hypothetical protein